MTPISPERIAEIRATMAHPSPAPSELSTLLDAYESALTEQDKFLIRNLIGPRKLKSNYPELDAKLARGKNSTTGSERE